MEERMKYTLQQAQAEYDSRQEEEIDDMSEEERQYQRDLKSEYEYESKYNR
jgi:hypothetical protein